MLSRGRSLRHAEGTITRQNFVNLAGSVGSARESRSTQGGIWATQLSLATSRPERASERKIMKDRDNGRIEDTEWHRITCFKSLAKIVDEHIDKGQKVLVRGSPLRPLDRPR